MRVVSRMGARLHRLVGGHEVWHGPGVRVFYHRELDGGGTFLARPLLDFIRANQGIVGPHGSEPSFKSVFEWCAGPGFIGFALLGEGLCERLCLADINPRAIECARKTVRANRLEDRVDLYVSDNFAAIPPRHQFDLVVANPPNYCGLNPEHPFYRRYKDDLRPNDRGWRIHKGFYAAVHSYLRDGASLVVSEIDPLKSEVRTPGFSMPYELRPRPAIDDFRVMIAAGGLTYVATRPLCMIPGGFRAAVVISRK